MSTNPRYSQYGGASSPSRGTGVYTGKITLIYDDGRVRVFINTFGRNIGPCRIINKSAGDAIALNDEVLCTYANDTSDELIVVGRLTERVDPVSESTSGLVVEASTTSELVRITQKGTGAALLIEDSTNPDSTPFIIDASGNVGIGLLSPSAKVDISGSAVISGDLTIDTTTLKVDSSNNRVGIGTSSPASKLHIADASGYGVQINTTTNLGLIGSNSESDGLRISGGIPDQVTVGGNMFLYGNTHATRPGDVAILTNGVEVLSVDSTGRVGIGTTTPTEKLDVVGNIFLTGSVVFEGATDDGFETTLTVTDPTTADRTITLPNNTGTVALLGDTTYVGTTAITLNRSSANLNLTGITSIAMPGSTSGTLTIQPTASAGTTTITFPATTGTVALLTNTTFIGTTSIALNRASASQALTGITSIDGSAATLTTTRTIWGQNFNGSANVSGSITGATTIAASSSVTAASFNIDSTHYLSAVTGEYGSIQVTGNNTSYAGYSINGNAVFMSNGSSFGLYDDTNNQWFMVKDFAGESRFYYAGVERILIKADGVSIRGSSSGTGVNGTLNAYAYYGNSDVAGTGSASYHPSGIYSTGTNYLYGTTYFNGNTLATVGHGQPSANNTYYWGLGVFGVNAWSTVGAYQFYNPSDIRYKQNIAPLPLGMNFLRLLDPIKFTYLYPQFTEESGNTPVSIDAGSRYRAGLSAQNVKEALNTLGSDDYAFWALVDKDDPENGVQILDYTGLVAPIIQALKEIDNRLQALENK